MNIFEQYGIREVADVVFYSITRIGTEEFYVPVLYLDTLKTTQLDKSVETVENFGGKGNGKLLAWNFVKDVKLSFEDALFSQMSMDAYMNGRVMAKMSDWTSAIAKLSVANKYGRKNYSIKAYPSPTLTPAEWEIVFRCAQKAGYDPRVGDEWMSENRDNANHNWKYIYNSETHDQDADKIVAENRWKLVDQYYRRTQPTPHNQDLSMYFDYNEEKYEGLSIIIKKWDKETEYRNAQQVHNMRIGNKWGGWIDLQISYHDLEKTSSDNYAWDVLQDNITENIEISTFKDIIRLHFCIEKTWEGYNCIWAYISADDVIAADSDGTNEILRDIFTGYDKTEFPEEDEFNFFRQTFHIGNEFFLSHILYYIFPNYLEDAIDDLCWCDLRDITNKAMPEKIIKEITKEITDFKKAGRFENDLYEAKKIDRMETVVVTDFKGFKINLIEQLENLRKFYNNAQESFTLYYDTKTMLPFVEDSKWDLTYKILDQKCVRVKGDLNDETILSAIKGYLKNVMNNDWVESLTSDDYTINKIVDNYGYKDYDYETQSDKYYLHYGWNRNWPLGEQEVHLVYFKIKKLEYLTLKRGTTYRKWTRTMDEDNTDLTYIGTNLSIDVDSLQGEYLITGETYIRQQKTGQDQRYQILIPRATVSPSASIKLSADGEPTVFSMDVNVLTPKDKKKAMVELIQYNVEEDKIEGGYKIVPQNKRHTFTPTVEIFEEIIPNNIEIY